MALAESSQQYEIHEDNVLVSQIHIKITYFEYRPGQPNWECTIWKFLDFSATQILREINFGDFEAHKH